MTSVYLTMFNNKCLYVNIVFVAIILNTYDLNSMSCQRTSLIDLLDN